MPRYAATTVAMMLIALTRASAQSGLAVPQTARPTADGRLEEWSTTAIDRLSDGSEVFLGRDSSHLFVGVVGRSAGFVSACVSRGDTIDILHASSALASARYVRLGSTWRRTRSFQFGMRAAKFDDVVLRSQQAYLDSAGWVGNTNTMSPRGKEMIISLALLERGSPRLAFGYYVEGRPPLAWPEVAADACVDAKVVAGFLPDSAEFHPERWRILQLRRE